MTSEKRKYICRIMYYDTKENKNKEVFGKVDRDHLFLNENQFLIVENVEPYVICKTEINSISILEEKEFFCVDKYSLAITKCIQRLAKTQS